MYKSTSAKYYFSEDAPDPISPDEDYTYWKLISTSIAIKDEWVFIVWTWKDLDY